MSVESPVLGGRYRLEGLIGRGGMASVWRATDTNLERLVAVKRLHARMHEDPDLAERFRREGQAVARLRHPNLVRLLDQGQEGDEPFLVFELVEGSDLKTMIRQDGRLPARDAAAICAQVARALASAHAAGVVHRDIKSHNVLVTPDGMAKLTDFGIARMMEAEGVNLTKTGIVLGSSDYLAPEQAEGKPVDARSDIYSLGVVLFEALTGRLPFTADSALAVATKHVYEPAADPQALAPAVPRGLADICLRALAKHPDDRFASAAAFADALEGRGEPMAPPDEGAGRTTGRLTAVTTPAPRRRRRRGAVLAVLGALLVAGAGIAGWQAGVFPGADGGAPGAGEPSRPLEFEPSAYDPLSDDGQEKPEQAPLAHDGNASTAWSTSGYASADLNGKGGVGLRLRFATPAVVRQVRVTSPNAGARVRILGPGSDAMTDRPVLAEAPLSAGTTEFALPGEAETQEIVVWIVELPSTRGGEFPFGAEIAEVEAIGVANT